ncbi:hypothetical protein HYH03_016219 [Edaphochlamys debaryana]|uniref:Calmodulin n=1 Tax=Edaphochlamys debaryana TaxID=47281 RepID=A0A835XMN6_9CHLO|nr:hypothetical protein HYH03_016219 [Edaphochlamys debaryana]|eukprot:KAG2485016.1 hypothetical protein HYH03_016219 [Edaphochlamys debaryana]
MRSLRASSSVQRSGVRAPVVRRPVAPLRPAVVARSSVDEGTVADDETIQKMEIMMERFKMADVDGNGFIDREELRYLLESMEGGSVYLLTEHWLPEDELDKVMAQYDTNKDGVISFEEFKQIVFDGMLLEGQLADYERCFRAVDKSGNGTIGATELGQLFAQLGTPLTPEKLVDLMQMYDKDESGQIEFDEFLLMFRNHALDIKAMNAYMLDNPNASAASMASGDIIDPIEGDMTLIFSEQELDAIVAAHPDKLVCIFGALTWCRPCKAMQRPVQRLAEHYKDSIVFVKLFGNANKQTKQLFKNRFQVRSTPCFITLKNGQPVYTQTGSNKEKLEAGLRSLVANPPIGMIYPSAEAVLSV